MNTCSYVISVSWHQGNLLWFYTETWSPPQFRNTTFIGCVFPSTATSKHSCRNEVLIFARFLSDHLECQGAAGPPPCGGSSLLLLPVGPPVTAYHNYEQLMLAAEKYWIMLQIRWDLVVVVSICDEKGVILHHWKNLTTPAPTNRPKVVFLQGVQCYTTTCWHHMPCCFVTLGVVNHSLVSCVHMATLAPSDFMRNLLGWSEGLGGRQQLSCPSGLFIDGEGLVVVYLICMVSDLKVGVGGWKDLSWVLCPARVHMWHSPKM